MGLTASHVLCFQCRAFLIAKTCNTAARTRRCVFIAEPCATYINIELLCWKFRLRQLVSSLSTRVSSRVCRTSSQQESILNLFPSTAKERSRICTVDGHIDGADRVDVVKCKTAGNNNVSILTIDRSDWIRRRVVWRIGSCYSPPAVLLYLVSYYVRVTQRLFKLVHETTSQPYVSGDQTFASTVLSYTGSSAVG